MGLLTEQDSLSFWGTADGGHVALQIPVLRNDRADQRGRWPGGDPPDWNAIGQELLVSRSAYFIRRSRSSEDNEIIRILTGRLVLQVNLGEYHESACLWLQGKGKGVRFATNFDRREFVAEGLPIRHEGIWLGSPQDFQRRFGKRAAYEGGLTVHKLSSVLNAAAERGDARAAVTTVKATSAAEAAFLSRLETVIDADHELEERAARDQPGFSYFAARSEPRRSSVKRYFRLSLVEADHQRLLAENPAIKLLALEHSDGQRVSFEIEDPEPTPGQAEIVVSTTLQTVTSDIPESGMVTRAASDTQYRVRKKAVDELRFRRANNRWLLGHAAGEGTFGSLSAKPFTPSSSEMVPNPSQLDAIAKGLATNDYVLVLGPPGTGKTTVISSWVERFVREGKRVLVTSQNNRAVDNVLERLARDEQLTCVRLGNEAKLSASMRDLLIDNRAVELQRAILSNIDERSAAVRGSQLQYERMMQALAGATDPAQIVRDVRTCAESIESDLGPLRRGLGIDAGSAWASALAAYAAFLDRFSMFSLARADAAGRSGWFRPWFWLLAFVYGLRARSVLRKSEQARVLLHDTSGAQLNRLQGLSQIVSAWHATLSNSRQQALYPLLLQLVNVVGATCIGIDTSRHFKDTLFDVVIVDEAGQIQIHNLVVPMAKGERVILVGDHKQLPPMVEAPLLAEVSERLSFEGGDEGVREAERLLKLSWFETMWDRTPADRKTMLDTQFRCPALISDFISEAFYDNRYFAADAMRLKKPLASPFSSTLVFIDTSALPARRRNEQGHQNTVLGNRCESEIVLSVLELMASHCPDLFEKREVGVIAPLKNHVAEIAGMMSQSMRAGRLPSGQFAPSEFVASLDSYQGQERDLVVFPFSRSNSIGKVGFLADWRRLNVAMTRAKRQLVFVGDLSTLTSAPHPDGRDATFKQAMKILKRHVETRGQLVSAHDWLQEFGSRS